VRSVVCGASAGPGATHHQIISFRLANVLYNYVRQNRLGEILCAAPFPNLTIEPAAIWE